MEKTYGVERWILTALWGMETDYGAEKDRWDVFRSLATLAYVKYRDPYFRNELLVAMRIMQDGKFPRDKMVSSWAGAMGQTQFMPTNVVDYAVAFSGDGKATSGATCPTCSPRPRTICTRNTGNADCLGASRCCVPPGFDTMKSRGELRRVEERSACAAPTANRSRPAGGILFFPAGAKGPAFIVTENYDVLKEYNNSDAYAIAVGHLADRMQGGPPFKTAWPADDHPLSRDARIALQKKLASLGYKVDRLRRPCRFRPARQYPRRAEEIRHGAGRQSDAGVFAEARPRPEVISAPVGARRYRLSFSASSRAISSR